MPSKPSIPRVCQRCGVGFLARPEMVRYGKALYCGRACRYAGRTPAQRSAHFWSKVDRGAPDACWPWTAATRHRLGYGGFFAAGKWTHAHRFAYADAIGPIPDGMEVCHSCDNPRCCNPAHLWIGTHKDNMDDRDAKGRGWWQR